MTKIIEKSKAEGRISAPTSKSVAHRMLIAAALCRGGASIIRGINPCEDIFATIDCLRSLGAKIEYENSCAKVFGADLSIAKPAGELFCRESGSTLRFIIPLLWLSGEEFTLTGSERLFARSMAVYEDVAEEGGFLFKKEGGKITTCGRLRSGVYRVRGDISSQFITGLLFALSCLDSDSEIVITPEPESRDYINITLSVMDEFGIKAGWKNHSTLYVKGGMNYEARELSVEGDWSNGAFLDAFNYLGGAVCIDGLCPESAQGDKIYREHFERLNKGFCEIDISDCPDLGPILFAFASLKEGGKFNGIRRLRDKESDRVASMMEELQKFGAEMTVEENSLTIKKCPLHRPTEQLFGHNDHRIVMSLAVISSQFGGEIEGLEAVNKSYPDFFKDINKLGIKIYDTK